ncbi:glycoside hydrolase family 30 protein [Zunongwangia profunda]|uniref:glycoside hydrolase family 30 protein n=1 Tax=Zunongwangia profunda TaxID=398743 RepID=UPI001D18FAF1|nr:glycoside hydrolase family 30 beta sandwich domain-containing protein [Zunongwangia profunda]MCC4226808.1 glucosylceramidase [Zunongwangia profunda]
MKLIVYLLLFLCLDLSAQIRPGKIQSWVTTPERSMLFQKTAEPIYFSNQSSGRNPKITIDPYQSFQSVDGFGFALTGGSADLLMKMKKNERSKILEELFSREGNGIGVSYIRLTMGASDLNSFTFSYDDLKEGERDYELQKFSLSQDLEDVIPVMKEILSIQPDIKIMASPWSAPIWMKTNKNIRGGKLRKNTYGVYARYFVKYVEAMRQQGINIDAVTIQNEPMNSRNTPSMSWLVNEQTDFVKNYLGPAFEQAGVETKIVIFDHNTDRPDYPLTILNDPEAAKYVDGSGFHNYRGDMEAMSLVHLARPDKNIYFTEQMLTEDPESKEINISAAVKRLILGPIQNWSKNIILWNLAADPQNDPHTDNGGCSMCQGAITINGNDISRNIAFYAMAHISKFVTPDSQRIVSTNPGDRSAKLYLDEQRANVYRIGVIENTQVLPNVAFKTNNGTIVLIVVNESYNRNSFQIQYKGTYAKIDLAPGAVGTYLWEE